MKLEGKCIKYNGKKFTITDVFEETGLIMLNDDFTISKDHAGINWDCEGMDSSTMKVKIKSRSIETQEDFDFRDELEISINDTKVFSVSDGEPEDSNLSRDFSDCFKIENLMKAAYDAGKNGEAIEFIYIEE